MESSLRTCNQVMSPYFFVVCSQLFCIRKHGAQLVDKLGVLRSWKRAARFLGLPRVIENDFAFAFVALKVVML